MTKIRSKRQLDKMHVWVHRRFHDATEGKYWRYWLAVREKIIDQIRAKAGALTFDQWLQVWAAEKTACALGFSMSYIKDGQGNLFIMSKSQNKPEDSDYKRKVPEKKRNRRGGKGGGAGLNVSRRTPYLT